MCRNILIVFFFTAMTVKAQVGSMNVDQITERLTKNNDTTFIVNFWATWCKPCVEELPVFESITQKYPKGRDWKEVIWALTTRMDATRDTTLVDNTPIDYLDFASPVAGLGSKMGLDATNKWPGETNREWGTPIVMDEAVKQRVDAMWGELGL